MSLLSHQARQPSVRIKRIKPQASLPAYQTPGSVGMDLPACLDAPVTLNPGEIRLIPCGFCMAIAPGFEGQIRPRSGLASKFGLTLPNTPGTVDSDYRGEIIVALINLGREPFTIEHGMRIAQMIIAPVAQARIQECDSLDDDHHDPLPPPKRGGDITRDVGVKPFPPPRDPAPVPALASRLRGAGGFGSTGL